MDTKLNWLVLAGLLIFTIVIAANFLGITTFTNAMNRTLQPMTSSVSGSSDVPPGLLPDSAGYTAVQISPTGSGNVPVPTESQGSGITSKSFPYVLRGQPGAIQLTLDPGVNTKISSGSPAEICIRNTADMRPCTSDELRHYFLNYINEPDQEKFLNAMVNSIRAQTGVRDDQARIAISLVQQIPYDTGELSPGGRNTTRYPYEVLYDDKGICMEKSFLLASLLQGLGYGVVLFEYPRENHMAVGIKSPAAYAHDNTGFAFVETSVPVIVTDDQEAYGNGGKLTEFPDIYPVSDGISFDSVSTEFQDARTFIRLEVSGHNSGGMLSDTNRTVWESLVRKYGLEVNSS
jgi:hypothetical protein